jgi:hypothetical protein
MDARRPKQGRYIRLALVCAAALAPLDALRAPGVGSAADLAVLAAVGLSLAALVFRPVLRKAWFWPYSRVMLAGTAFWFTGMVGTWSSTQLGVSVADGARLMVAMVGLPFAMAMARPTRADVRLMAWAYVLAVWVSAIYSTTNPNPANGRSPGLTQHVNSMGATSYLAFALLLGLLTSGWYLTGRRRSLRWAGVGVLGGGLILGMMNSGSRAAVIGAAAVVIAFLWATRNRLVLAWCGLAAVVLVVMVGFGQIEISDDSAVGRLLGSETSASSDQGRAERRSTVNERVAEHPVFGSGFADATEAHNLYIEAVDIGGVVGLAAFAWVIVAVLRPLVRARRDPFVAGGFAAAVGFFVAGVGSNVIWDRWVWVPLTIALGACATRSGLGADDGAVGVRGRGAALDAQSS